MCFFVYFSFYLPGYISICFSLTVCFCVLIALVGFLIGRFGWPESVSDALKCFIVASFLRVDN